MPALEAALRPLLALYPLLRSAHARRLRAGFAALPRPNNPGIPAYYRMRLGLLLRSLRLHGKPIPEGSVHVTGLEYYREALESARPVALLGLHAGVLELLHRVPDAPKDRPFLILTAPAFAPALSAFMAKGRERDGKRVVWNRKPIGTPNPPGLELSAGLRSVLKSKGVLALMTDQVPGPAPEAEYLCPWSKLKVPYPARLLDFLAKNGFLVLPVSTSLQADGKSIFRFHVGWDPEDKSAGAAPLQSYLQAFLEVGIAQAPVQWNWSYPKIAVLPMRIQPDSDSNPVSNPMPSQSVSGPG